MLELIQLETGKTIYIECQHIVALIPEENNTTKILTSPGVFYHVKENIVYVKACSDGMQAR